MNKKPLKTEAEYKNAVKRFEEIFHALPGTPENKEAEILGTLIDDFEKKHYPIQTPRLN